MISGRTVSHGIYSAYRQGSNLPRTKEHEPVKRMTVKRMTAKQFVKKIAELESAAVQVALLSFTLLGLCRVGVVEVQAFHDLLVPHSSQSTQISVHASPVSVTTLPEEPFSCRLDKLANSDPTKRVAEASADAARSAHQSHPHRLDTSNVATTLLPPDPVLPADSLDSGHS